MADPTTGAGLQTRATAVRVELQELASGARKLGGGTDGGTQRQKDAADGLAHRFELAAQELAPQRVSDTIANLT